MVYLASTFAFVGVWLFLKVSTSMTEDHNPLRFDDILLFLSGVSLVVFLSSGMQNVLLLKYPICGLLAWIGFFSGREEVSIGAAPKMLLLIIGMIALVL